LDDEVSVIIHCLEDAGLTGPVNATTPHPATDAELAKSMGAALHRPTVLAVPAVALRLALGSEMADQLVLGGQRVFPEVLQSRGFTFAHTDLDEAVRSVLAPA
jgi:NAD dependent epimerase/dehydratase family enzyme